MQSACNRAKWARPFDSNAPSMEAQAHTSCNRRAGCYVRATAPSLAPLPRLLDCRTSTATRGNPAYDPAVPARHDGQYGQKWASSNGGGRRAGAAVTSSAKLTSASRTTRPVALTPRRDRRRLRQEKQATLRHNDRIEKGTPRHSISYPFPLSLSYNRDRERGIPRKGPFSVKETCPEPPY
jgi:hypothetical protein